MRRPGQSLRLLCAGCAACVIAGGAGTAAAEGEPFWREGQPPVLTPQAAPSNDRAALVARFGGAWRDAGQPRIAVLWERAFDDRLSEFQTDFRLTASENRWRAEDVEEDGHDGRSEARATAETMLRMEIARDEAGRPSQLSEADRLRMEAGFSRAFLEAGATLVDRAAAMRILHAERAAGDPPRRIDDRQQVETEALRAHADMILEIAAASDTGGAAFRISAIDLRTGALAARLFAAADALSWQGADKGEWRAVRGGYTRVREGDHADFEEKGRVLALRAMEELLRAWR